MTRRQSKISHKNATSSQGAISEQSERESIFEENGRWPDQWAMWASHLHEASKRLRTRFGGRYISDPYNVADTHLRGGLPAPIDQWLDPQDAVSALLLAYSFECVLKGMWINLGNRLVRDGRYTRIPGVGDHDLLALAKCVNLNASPEEFIALDRLTPFVRFAGRYPIPIAADEMKPREVPGRGKVNPRFYSRAEFLTADILANRLIEDLFSGWKPPRES
jgi:hypothetical protein